MTQSRIIHQEPADVNNEDGHVNHEMNHKQDTTSHGPATPMQGPITRSRAKKLQQQVNSLLNKFNSTSNENFILPKCSTLLLIRFTHKEELAAPAKNDHTKDGTSCIEAERAYCLLTSEPSSKSHKHQTVNIHQS